MAQAQVVITGVDRTQSAINSAMRGLKGLGDQAGLLKRAFAGIGAVAVTSFLTRTATAAIQYGDELQKASVKSGVAVEQLSALAYAAKQSDIDLGSLSENLKKMQIALSQASTGGKAQKETLDALGISLREIEGLNADEQFMLIAQQISSLKDPADRARAAVEIFGRSGANLLPLFEKGAEGIRAATEEAKRLGLVLSTEQAQKLAAADDAVKRLSSSWDGFAASLMSKVSPALTAILDQLSGAANFTKEGLNTRLSGLQLGILNVGKRLGDVLSSGPNIKGRQELIDKLTQDLLDQNKKLEAVMNQLQPKPAEAKKEETKAEGYNVKESAKKIEEVIITSQKKTLTAMQTLVDQYNNNTKTSFEKAASELAAFGAQTDTLVQERIISLETAAQRMEEANRRYMDAVLPELRIESKKVSPELAKTNNEMTEFARTAASNIQSAFANFLFDPFKDGLRGMLSGLVDILRRMVAEIAAQQLLLAFFGMFTGGTGFLASFSKAAVDQIKGKATGGPVSSGMPYIVGERGPELFVPGTSGGIVPNNRLAMGGGVTVAPVYNIDARGATADLQAALPAILSENNRRIFDELDRRYGIGR